MVGFAIGLGIFILVVHAARRYRRYKYGYGGYRRPGWGGRRARWGRRFMLRRVFDRLDTMPGQEKAIMAAFDELFETGAEVREDLRQARAELAQALREEYYDQGYVDEVFTRYESTLDRMKSALNTTLGRVHDALDEGQREELAGLIEKGGGWRGHGRRACARA